MLLVNQNNVVDAKSVNASLIALKNQADKLNRQIVALEKSIKSLDGSKVDEKDLSNYYTKDETYNKTEVYNKQSVDSALANLSKVKIIQTSDCNNAYPDDNGKKETYFADGTASNTPNNSYLWFIESERFFYSNNWRITQIATSQSASTTNKPQQYIRHGTYVPSSSTWTWGSWEQIITDGMFEYRKANKIYNYQFSSNVYIYLFTGGDSWDPNSIDYIKVLEKRANFAPSLIEFSYTNFTGNHFRYNFNEILPRDNTYGNKIIITNNYKVYLKVAPYSGGRIETNRVLQMEKYTALPTGETEQYIL